MGDQDLDYGYYHLGIILQFFAHFSFKHLDLCFLIPFLALYHGIHHHETPTFFHMFGTILFHAASKTLLGGGFKYFSFSSLFGEDSHFD